MLQFDPTGRELATRRVYELEDVQVVRKSFATGPLAT
jgi:hypothetical protein